MHYYTGKVQISIQVMSNSTGIFEIQEINTVFGEGKLVGYIIMRLKYMELQGVNGRQRGKNEGGRMSKTRRGGKDEKGSREWFAKCYVVEK